MIKDLLIQAVVTHYPVALVTHYPVGLMVENTAFKVALKAEDEILRQVGEILPQVPKRFNHNKTCFDCVQRIMRQAMEG